MRVLYIVGRELRYPRNDVLLRAFQRFSRTDVVGTEHKSPSLLLSNIKLTFNALPKLLYGDYDLIFVGFYGHLIMLITGLVTKRRSIPILFDAFVSTYDTLVSDRKKAGANSLIGKLSFWLDRMSCGLASHILIDTVQQADYFSKTFALSLSRLSVIPVGCNEDLFFPRPRIRSTIHPIVLYYSSYLPLHGTEIVVKAAAQLQSLPIQFRLIGNGQEYKRATYLTKYLKLRNIKFIPYIPLQDLPNHIAEADIVLGGHFGLNAKANRVIPGKVYQILAMGRPLIASSTPANLELLHHGENAYLCPPGDPDALANAILELYRSPSLRERLSVNARNLYLNTASEYIITQRLQQIVNNLLG